MEKKGVFNMKKVMASVLALTMAVSLAACGSSPEKTQEPKSEAASTSGQGQQDTAKKGEGQTIEVWTQWTAGSDKETYSLEMIKKFEEETGYKVNCTNFTYDMLHEKVLTAAAGGNVPDCAWGLPEYIGEFYNMGILEDLTDEFNAWDEKDVFSESVVKAMSMDGQVVAMPYEMSVRAFLVHEGDFEAAGMEVPATWEDLLNMEGYYDAQGKYPFEITGSGVRAAQELLVYLAQSGVEIATLQEDGLYKNTWNENPDQLDKAAKVFQFYKDLIDKGIVNPSARNWTWEETDENLCTGLVSSHVSGNWLRNKESQNPETMKDMGAYAIPYPEGSKPYTYMECKPMFVFKDSKNKEGAVELMKAIAGKEWQEKVWAYGSPRSDVYSESIWSKGFSDIGAEGISFPGVTLAGVTQAMNESIAKVLQEGKTPQEAAAWLSDAVNASLSDTGELSK